MRGKNDTNYRGFFSALVYNPVHVEWSEAKNVRGLVAV